MKRSSILFIALFLSASIVAIEASDRNISNSKPETTDSVLTQSSSQQTDSEIIVPELSPEARQDLEETARNITVKVTTQENGGSGVLIGKQDNSYLVLTNAHVIYGGETFELQTADGRTHQATLVSDSIGSQLDMVLLQFGSKQDYETATLSPSQSALEPGVVAFAGGYSAETGEFVTSSGAVILLSDRALKDGYQIGYTSDIESGMSGGPILNDDLQLIGINGRSSFPILNTGFIYEDGTQPSPEKIEQMRQYSWGVPTYTLLTQMDSNLITAYNLPLPEAVAEVKTPELTGWLGELEATAKQITVRIDNTENQGNGSGIIIAKQGSTYTVLTANHVICQDESQEQDEPQSCKEIVYEIVTHDDRKHPIEVKTIRRQEGVDLAVVEFNSDEDYQVAQLAEYPLTNGNAVFVAGYPKLSSTMPAQWRFSPGYGLDREQGLFEVSDNILKTDLGLISPQGSLSGGYEMVYSSITYVGMSGGAVLDKEGRVIGIHGLAEGQTTVVDSKGNIEESIQLGYSLGIPVTTFIGLADRFNVRLSLPIEEERPPKLTSVELNALVDTILNIEIPQGNATAENELERGNQLWRLGRYDEAVAAFEKVIDLEPEFIHLAYHSKGLALINNKRYEAGLENLERAIEANSEFMPTYLYKSGTLFKLNQLQPALVAVDKAIALELAAIDKAIEADNANSYRERGGILSNLYSQKSGILSGLGIDEDAVTAITRAIELTPRSAFYANRGNFYVKQDELDKALDDYNRAIEINPNSASGYVGRGVVYRERDELDKALDNYDRAIEIAPNHANAFNNRGNVYHKQGELELALDDYDRAIEIAPNHADDAYFGRGNVYRDWNELDKALDNYDRAIEINSNHAPAFNNRGNVYHKQGELELALDDLDRAIEIDLNFPEPYISRGNLYKQRNQLNLALADYDRAIEINRDYADAYFNRGIAKGELEQYVEAIPDFDKAIEINPDDAEAYFNRGVTKGNLKQHAEAILDFDKSIEIKPQWAEAYFNRGNAKGELEQYVEAIPDFDKAIEVNPDYVEAYYNRGIAKVNLKQHAEAIPDFDKSIEINPDDAEAYFNRGVTKGNLKQHAEAIADYDKAIEINPDDAKAYFNRGVSYLSLNNQQQGQKDFQQAARLFFEQGDNNGYQTAMQALQHINNSQ